MLPGSDFGLQQELFITRIAFVDFEGKKALELIRYKNLQSYDFLKTACPKIIEGIEKLKKWIKLN